MTPKSPYVWTAPGWSSEMPSGKPDAEEIWVYADKYSYGPDESVALHVHTTAERYDVDIIRDGAHPERMLSLTDRPGRLQPTPADSYAAGCGWEVTDTFTVPAEWKPGFYLVLVRFIDRAGAPFEGEGFFVVRAQAPTNDAVILLTTSTMTAYNDWGGANHYRGLSEDPRNDIASPVLSTLRPVARGMCRLPPDAPREGHREAPPQFAPPRYRAKEWARLRGRSRHYASAFWATYERHFVVWAEQQGYTFDYLTQQDLDRSIDCLDGYRCAIIVGHDEYWSWRMRDALDRFLDEGGNVARFAGNFEWQIRLEDNGTRQICYKSRAKDPVEDPRFTTIMWDHPVVSRPAAQTMGLTGMGGIYTRYGVATPRSSGGFTVYRPDHWVFEKTDLYYGDVLGGAPSYVVAFEVDGVDYTFRKGLPYPTYADGAPESLEILAMAPAVLGETDRFNGTEAINGPEFEFLNHVEEQFGDDLPEYLQGPRYGAGMIGVSRRGTGTVVNIATTDWVTGLDHRDPYVEQVTHNVLRRLTSGRDQ